MKKLVGLLVGLVFGMMVLSSCGECDGSKFYQIKVKNESGPTMCRYEADGLGPCTTWQKTESIFFTDSCKRFKLSEILTRAEIDRYRSASHP